MDNAGAEGDSSSLTDLQIQIVWLVRILLPIIFFIAWYRGQAQAQGADGRGGKHRYARDVLVAARRGADERDVPDVLSSIKLMDEASVQKALGGPPPRPRGSGPDAGGRSGARPKRQPGVDRVRSGNDVRRTNSRVEAQAEAATPTASGGPKLGGSQSLTEEERSSLEALFNFAALGQKDRQRRVFLPSGQPPPPPRRPAQRPKADAMEEAKANGDAQTILKGAVNPKIQLKCPELAKALHQRLSDSNARPSEATYSLMVEACVISNDLKGASDFLMKMESAGHSADSELLDKVMDLYSESWSAGGAAAGDGEERPLSSAERGPMPAEDEEDVWEAGEDDMPSRSCDASSPGSLTRRPLAAGSSLRPAGAARSASSRAARRDSDGGLWSDDG